MIYSKLKTKVLVLIASISLLVAGCSSNDNSVVNSNENTDRNDKIQVEEVSSENLSNDEQEEKDSIESAEVSADVNIVSNNVNITFFDTGNSDSILLEDNGKFMLIDAGDRDDDSLVLKLLREKGVSELEYFVITHVHSDHLGAADTVLKEIKVNNLLVSNGSADTKVYRDFIESAAKAGVNPSVPLEGSEFKLGNSSFKVLNTRGSSDANNSSLVVDFNNGKDRALFMGDSEKEVEAKILDKVGPVGLLKAGHHGSSSSSSKSFIDKLGNPMVVIQVSSDNKYGHPHKEVMNLFSSKSLEVHRNDTCGSIDILSTGNGFTTNCKVAGYDSGSSSKSSYVESSDSSSNTNNTPLNTTSGNGSSATDSSSTIFYTPNGKSYHTTDSCSTLSRSKTILSSTISESGKNDPCDRCH